MPNYYPTYNFNMSEVINAPPLLPSMASWAEHVNERIINTAVEWYHGLLGSIVGQTGISGNVWGEAMFETPPGWAAFVTHVIIYGWVDSGTPQVYSFGDRSTSTSADEWHPGVDTGSMPADTGEKAAMWVWPDAPSNDLFTLNTPETLMVIDGDRPDASGRSTTEFCIARTSGDANYDGHDFYAFGYIWRKVGSS